MRIIIAGPRAIGEDMGEISGLFRRLERGVLLIVLCSISGVIGSKNYIKGRGPG
jgi:hypothetical protein